MEAIGKQVRLPMSTAVQIAMQGIRIRLGRALVTITGVVLGIAFLMNVLSASLISRAVTSEQDRRMKVDMMVSLVKSEIGDMKGRLIGVVAVGELADHERATLRTLLRGGAKVQATGAVQVNGIVPAPLDAVGDGAHALLVFGAGKDCPASVDVLTANMHQKVILDSRDDRTFAGRAMVAAAGVSRELFFGKRMADEQLKKQEEAKQARFRTIWIVTISLLVTIIGIANALLMSVTERFKEIGTMKCLGALSSFIRQLFLIESAFIGVVGSLLGILIGIIFPMLAYSIAYGFHNVFGSIDYAQLGLISLGCLIAGTLLSIIAAIYPATIAARMIPAMALRTNV